MKRFWSLTGAAVLVMSLGVVPSAFADDDTMPATNDTDPVPVVVAEPAALAVEEAPAVDPAPAPEPVVESAPAAASAASAAPVRAPAACPPPPPPPVDPDVEAMPIGPRFEDVCEPAGGTNDKIIIPMDESFDYFVDGVLTAPGTYPAPEHVVIVATPKDGFVAVPGVTLEWDITFAKAPCQPPVVDTDDDGVPDDVDQCPSTPPGQPVDDTGCSAWDQVQPPTVDDVCGPGGTYTLPVLPEGYTWQDTAGSILEPGVHVTDQPSVTVVAYHVAVSDWDQTFVLEFTDVPCHVDPPVVPEPKVWQETNVSGPTCADPTVTTTVTQFTEVYGLVDGEIVVIETTDEVISSESRPATDEEMAALSCDAVIPPPPVDRPTPPVPPAVTPPVVQNSLVPVIDICTNIPGIQSGTQDGMLVHSDGTCYVPDELPSTGFAGALPLMAAAALFTVGGGGLLFLGRRRHA